MPWIGIALLSLLGWRSWVDAQAEEDIPLEILCFDPIACALYDPTTGQSQPTQNASDSQAVDASPDQMYTYTQIRYDGLQCNFVKEVNLRGQKVVLPVWFKNPGIGLMMVPVLKPNQTWDPATPIPPPPDGHPPYPNLTVDASGTHLVDNPPCTAQNPAPAPDDTYSQWTYTEQMKNLPGLECNSVTSTSLASGPTVLPVWLKKGSTGIGLISVPNEPATAKWGDPPIPIKPPAGDYEPLNASCGWIQGQDPPCSNPNAPDLSKNWTPVKSDMQLPPGQNGKIHTTVNCVELDLPVYNDNGSALIMIPPVVFGAIVAGANAPDIIAGTLPPGLTPLEIAADGSVVPDGTPAKDPNNPKPKPKDDAGGSSVPSLPGPSSSSTTSRVTSTSVSASASASASNQPILGTVKVLFSINIATIKAASSSGNDSGLNSADVPAIVGAVPLGSPALGGICRGRCLSAGGSGNVSTNPLDETVPIEGGPGDAGSVPVQGQGSAPGQPSPSPSVVPLPNPFGGGGSGTAKRSRKRRRRVR